MMRGTLSLGLGLLLAGCISVGPKSPKPITLMTLVPAAPAQPDAALSATAADTVAVNQPMAPQALSVTRVPVYDGGAEITYLKGATWSEVPTTLFRALLSETVTARTGRMVVDNRLIPVAPGRTLSGRLLRFGVDAPSQSVVLTYDAMLIKLGSPQLIAHRFEARVPIASITARDAAPALNAAANRVANDVADWVRAN